METLIIICSPSLHPIVRQTCSLDLYCTEVSALIKDDLHCKVLPPHAPGLLLVRVVQLLSGQDHPLVTEQNIACTTLISLSVWVSPT